MPVQEGGSFQARLEEAKYRIQVAYDYACNKITPDRLFNYAARLSEVRAPSGTVSFTLGPQLQEFTDVRRRTASEYNLIAGNPVLTVGKGLKQEIVISAHADEVSYGVKRIGKSEVPLWANSAHRQSVPKEQKNPVLFPAEAWRYAETEDGPALEQIAHGDIATDKQGNTSFVTEHGPEDELRPGDRVVFNPFPGQKRRLQRSEVNPDLAEGVVDNRIGMAGALLVARTMTTLHDIYTDAYGDLRTRVVFDDREEGVPDGRFGGGMQDFVITNGNTLDIRYIVYDGHDAASRNLPQSGLFTEVVSGGKGPVLTPERVYRLNAIAQVLRDDGADIEWDQEVGATTSRSADNGLKNAGVPDSNITIVGYAEHGPHHQDMVDSNLQPAVASLQSAVESARLIVALNAAATYGLL